MKIIQITDFHLVPSGERVFGFDTAERVEQCLADIARWHADADFCVISGDLTNKGEPAAYAWLADRLARFPISSFVIPGNHDERSAMRDAFPHIACDDAGFMQYAVAHPEGVVLFLDTLKGPVSEGEYCSRRRSWLTSQLAAAQGQPVWIFMHHPPFDVGIPYMDRIKLEEPEAFAEVIALHDDIRHIFFGHIHRAAYINWRGISCTSLPGICHQIPLNRESIGGAPYSVEPPMYGVILINDGETTVHFEAYRDRASADMV